MPVFDELHGGHMHVIISICMKTFSNKTLQPHAN